MSAELYSGTALESGMQMWTVTADGVLKKIGPSIVAAKEFSYTSTPSSPF
jgi:hypothetical protein